MPLVVVQRRATRLHDPERTAPYSKAYTYAPHETTSRRQLSMSLTHTHIHTHHRIIVSRRRNPGRTARTMRDLTERAVCKPAAATRLAQSLPPTKQKLTLATQPSSPILLPSCRSRLPLPSSSSSHPVAAHPGGRDCVRAPGPRSWLQASEKGGAEARATAGSRARGAPL